MNRTLVIITHGRFGEELLKSTSMIIGKMKNTLTFSLTEETAPEQFISEITSELAKHEGKKLILVDLFGGTPFNTAAYLLQNEEVDIITGVNLPLVIESYNEFIVNGNDDIQSLLMIGKESIRHLNKI